jgi:hypothetical protein
LAGNPYAYLMLESDQPGGIVGVDLWLMRGGLTGLCTRNNGFDPDPAAWLSHGAADLRFMDGNFVGQAFPVSQATPVRVDMFNVAADLLPGDRLVLTLSGTGWERRDGQPYMPLLDVQGGTGPTASHIVLPFVSGTLGGSAPTIGYPERPFAHSA